MDKPVSQVLEEAADLLAKPGAWTRFPAEHGGWGEKTTTCWTVLEAIMRAAGFATEAQPAVSFFLERAYCESGYSYFGKSQDADVSLLRRAAALAKEQGR